MPSQTRPPRGRRRPDPIEHIFDTEVVPLLEAAPGIRPVAVFGEMLRRHPDLVQGVRRTLERRIRAWRAVHGPEQEVIFRLRGSRDFDDLAAYRAFVDEIVARRNAAQAKRIDAERSHLRPLPARRTTDFEEVAVTVSRTGGFTLRKVFYTVPSRLIEQQFMTDGLPHIPVNFFHVETDSPGDIWSWLIERVKSIRDAKVERIRRHVASAEDLVTNADVAKTREARTTIAETMDKAAERFKELPPVTRPAASNLVAEVKKTHQSSVAASVNRRGDWPQFPVPHILGQQVHKRYSAKAAEHLRRRAAEIDMDALWAGRPR